MVRIGGGVVGCQVAAGAQSRRADKHVVNVALHAGHGSRVEARQREWRVVVIEHSAGPGGRCVASVACGREARCNVGRTRRTHVERVVAAIASDWQCPLIVVCRGVALHALHG